jgi:hypothetical protein
VKEVARAVVAAAFFNETGGCSPLSPSRSIAHLRLAGGADPSDVTLEACLDRVGVGNIISTPFEGVFFTGVTFYDSALRKSRRRHDERQ